MVTKSASASSSIPSTSSADLLKKSSATEYPSFSVKQFSMNNVLDQIKKADKDLDTLLSKQTAILKLERQSGIKKTHMVYAINALAVFFLLYYFATTFVVSIVLFAYPMFLSLEAVESHDKAKDAQILSYWSIIALIQLIEATLPFIRRYIPFYNLLKLTLSVYLYLPQTTVKSRSHRVIFN